MHFEGGSLDELEYTQSQRRQISLLESPLYDLLLELTHVAM